MESKLSALDCVCRTVLKYEQADTPREHMAFGSEASRDASIRVNLMFRRLRSRALDCKAHTINNTSNQTEQNVNNWASELDEVAGKVDDAVRVLSDLIRSELSET
jgi:hypothetical protein